MTTCVELHDVRKFYVLKLGVIENEPIYHEMVQTKK